MKRAIYSTCSDTQQPEYLTIRIQNTQIFPAMGNSKGVALEIPTAVSIAAIDASCKVAVSVMSLSN